MIIQVLANGWEQWLLIKLLHEYPSIGGGYSEKLLEAMITFDKEALIPEYSLKKHTKRTHWHFVILFQLKLFLVGLVSGTFSEVEDIGNCKVVGAVAHWGPPSTRLVGIVWNGHQHINIGYSNRWKNPIACGW